MSEAGGWAVAPWATPARNLQPQAEDHPINHPISNILLFSPNPKYAVACCPLLPVVGVRDDLGLLAGDAAVGEGEAGGAQPLVAAHRVLGRQLAVVLRLARHHPRHRHHQQQCSC